MVLITDTIAELLSVNCYGNGLVWNVPDTESKEKEEYEWV